MFNGILMKRTAERVYVAVRLITYDYCPPTA